MMKRSKSTCDGVKNQGPKYQDCLESELTLNRMMVACHGDYLCKVEAHQEGVLLEDPACKDPVKELTIKYICGMKSYHGSYA